jgi:hypothetical protein
MKLVSSSRTLAGDDAVTSHAKLLTLELPLGISADAPPGFVDKVGRLEQERLDRVVACLVAKEGFSQETVLQMRIEFLRFISLRWVYDGGLVPSGVVDEFWHTFILFTRDYAAFCERHFGYFLHHTPTDDTDEARLKGRNGAQKTRELIARYYPEFDVQMWSNHGNCCDGENCSS